MQRVKKKPVTSISRFFQTHEHNTNRLPSFSSFLLLVLFLNRGPLQCVLVSDLLFSQGQLWTSNNPVSCLYLPCAGIISICPISCLCGSGELNPGPWACKANTLPADHSFSTKTVLECVLGPREVRVVWDIPLHCVYIYHCDWANKKNCLANSWRGRG